MSCAAPKVPREIARVSDLPYRSDRAGFAPLRMRHMTKDKPNIVKKCDLPLTSARPVSVVVTELAVIDFPEGRARLCEMAPGVTVEHVVAHSQASLIVPGCVQTMTI